MGTETPIKPLQKPVDKPAGGFDRFHPQMPEIPGVSDLGARTSGNTVVGPANRERLVQIMGVVAAVLVVAVAISWWIRSRPRGVPEPDADETPIAASAAMPPPQGVPAPRAFSPAADGSVQAATTDELAKPWSARKFVYVNPLTHESVDATVIRLPTGVLWAFSLQEPYGRCQLEYVTDLARLANQYKFRASHPMVANPCNSTIYDPLKVDSTGGAWVRGEVVQGDGLRPPISIDVKTSGHAIIADRIE